MKKMDVLGSFLHDIHLVHLPIDRLFNQYGTNVFSMFCQSAFEDMGRFQIKICARN
jgi:hypothetical protein